MAASRARAALLTGVLVAALGAGTTGAADTARRAPPDPDPGFLEFLGSVDGLAEVSPDYLAHADSARLARPGVKGRTSPTPPPAPSPGTPGGKNNE